LINVKLAIDVLNLYDSYNSPIIKLKLWLGFLVRIFIICLCIKCNVN